MFTLNPLTSDTPKVPVTAGGQTFTMLCRRPTAQERIDDNGTAIELRMKSGDEFAAAFRRRFYLRLACVIGWTDVQDTAGNPVPFTPALLTSTLNRYPELLDQLSEALQSLYDVNETAVGEPGGKPDESPTGSPEKQTQS